MTDSVSSEFHDFYEDTVRESLTSILHKAFGILCREPAEGFSRSFKKRDNRGNLLWDCYPKVSEIEIDWAQAAFLLEAGAGTEWRGEHGYTAIMWAAIRGSLVTVTLLFNRGANIHAQDIGAWNALMWARYCNHTDIVSFLADKGTDIHVRSNQGQDALLLAALWGRIDAALDLIARQADARVVDGSNQTALTHFGSDSHGPSRTLGRTVTASAQRRSSKARPA
jgi:ankyrin repeat protein